MVFNTDNFMELLYENNNDNIVEFINNYGKLPKPCSPIYFNIKDTINNSSQEKERKNYE